MLEPKSRVGIYLSRPSSEADYDENMSLDEIDPAEESATPYEWAGLNLTPALMASLVHQLFEPGDLIQRSQMIERIVSYHLSRGGTQSLVHPVSQMKKALQDLDSAGDIEKTGVQGVWRILKASGEAADKTESVVFTKAADLPDAEVAQLEVEYESGVGNGSVYVYYYPGYFRESGEFPIKVGMSSGSYARRISEQLGTSTPELPVVYRVLHTETPRVIERYLHSALSLLGCKIDDVPGDEWFRTRPERIDELLRNVGLPA